ncbi:hypothetical protein Cgig2_004338 [Carnegiea gigantea]|uniref:Bet v I/Major latex protein domain-containing protein n=1 Tax=Carnegiea gigantea TaxID=171969 RepID=A0A9Q1GXK3_9CARY|nr:hypothetical protein Cgig2_004338 [Carnegiea gigantea]
MGIKGKLEVEVDIKISGDLFHELFGSRPHHVPNITPDKIHNCEVHEGEFGKPGSVLYWNYTLGQLLLWWEENELLLTDADDGKKCVAKVIVEAIDKENKCIRFKVIEGDLLNEFKSLTVNMQAIPMGEVTGVKWIAEFEKIHDDGPYPAKLMDFAVAITRDIEAHHLKN